MATEGEVRGTEFPTLSFTFFRSRTLRVVILKIMPQDTENVEKNNKGNFADLGSILNLCNAQLEYPDPFSQLNLRQAEPFSDLYDFFDKLVFLA